MPSRSLPELQLGEATLHDIEAGRFHVWAVEQLDDALELLLGRPAGRTARGFSAGSVYALAGRRMRAMSERLHPPRRAVKPGGHKSSAGAAKSPQAKPKPKPTGKQDA